VQHRQIRDHVGRKAQGDESLARCVLGHPDPTDVALDLAARSVANLLDRAAVKPAGSFLKRIVRVSAINAEGVREVDCGQPDSAVFRQWLSRVQLGGTRQNHPLLVERERVPGLNQPVRLGDQVIHHGGGRYRSQRSRVHGLPMQEICT
jgi:hypothetical protein